MKIRLSDYIAQFMVDHGVEDVFTVVGGGAMYLNDSFGHHPALQVTYNHHEQGSAIAAEAYARLENKIATLCVTTGPGGTNALTGVVGGWLDSIPMFVVSGQVRYDTTARYGMRFTDGLPLRSIGDQEFDIVHAVKTMTKYAVMLENPTQIAYELEKAWYCATTGRPGPVWVDVPVNFQGSFIETNTLPHFEIPVWDEQLPPSVEKDTVLQILKAIKQAKRPVIYAGGGVRLSGAFRCFQEVVRQLNVPVVTYWNSIDLMEDTDTLYVGRGGNMGNRAGNFAVQNADLLLAIGTRISIRQTGYAFDTWAREAKVIMVDIDRAELKKHTIHVDIPVWADAKNFLQTMADCIAVLGSPVNTNQEWVETCNQWKQNYPVTLPRHEEEREGSANVYAFVHHLSAQLPENSLTAVSNGACCVVGHQSYIIKKDSRFIINNAIASMGYGLPAAIGVCVAAQKKETICLEGDGSIMMNLQELQTIVTNRLPIKIFLINNNGYHSIRLTQNNLFKDSCKIGIGPESNDLGFPCFAKIANAFGLPYYSATNNAEMKNVVKEVLAQEDCVFCEIFTDSEQVWEPKSSTKRLPDGRLVSPPLEDLAPFLPREELSNNMFIPLIEEPV